MDVKACVIKSTMLDIFIAVSFAKWHTDLFSKIIMIIENNRLLIALSGPCL